MTMREHLSRLQASIVRLIRHRPHWAMVVILLAYLAILQTRFLFRSDAWAEGYAEYLVNALTVGWQGFFILGWANYFNLIPKLLCDIYVSLHLPIGYIDYYYHVVVVGFAVGSIAFIAHPLNRRVIANDYLRGFLALATMLSLYHVSSFSFINVWYIGFVVVIMVSLGAVKLQLRQQTLYTIFAVAVSLTKPSIVLLPLVVYRVLKTREYLSGIIISLAILLQTVLMLVSYKITNVEAIRLTTKAVMMTLGTGLLALKTLHIYPVGFWLVIWATLLLGCLAFCVARAKGLVFLLAVAIPLALSVYTYYFVPDLPTPILFKQFQAIYLDDFKLQRSIMVSFLVLLLLYVGADIMLKRSAKWRVRRFDIVTAVLASLTVLLVVQYRPIDLQDARFSSDISQFRDSLNKGESVCMAIAPHPGWQNYLNVPPGTWFFQYNGGCLAENYDKTVDEGDLNEFIGPGWEFTVAGAPTKQLKALLVPVRNPETTGPRRLELHDDITGQIFSAVVRGKTNHEQLSFVSFNLTGDSFQEVYHFRLVEPGNATSNVRAGSFDDGSKAYYSLFMGYPNLSERKNHR